jgi:2-keto-4-pentenoate hydratase
MTGISTGNKFSAREASEILLKHWQDGTTLTTLPAHLKPTSIAEGLEIQAFAESLTLSPLWGWKIAATSAAGQGHINVDRPLAGRILKERVTPYGQPVSLDKNHMKVAELEFAFRIGQDIEPREDRPWRVQEIMDKIDGLFIGSELPDSRYEDCTIIGAAGLLADNACADRYVLGPEIKEWKAVDLVSYPVKGWVVGREAESLSEGKGGNVLGDPRIAMTWLANELGSFGIVLLKGQFVTTGTCIVPISVKAGERMVGDFGHLGRIEQIFVD